MLPWLASLLALATLVPVGTLLVEHWQHLAMQKSAAEQEREGVAYVAALSQVTLALTDAQAAAIRGEPVPQQPLADAVAATNAVDERVGEQLRVRERWSQLQGRMANVTTGTFAHPRGAHVAYREATDLLLELYTKLQEMSGLIQDPETDVFYLQAAASQELPQAVVAANRLVDLLVIAGRGGTDQQETQDTEISVTRADAAGHATAVAVGLQAALDSTVDRTLSSDVLTSLDRFLREKDLLLAAVPPDGRTDGVDLDAITGYRESLQATARQLSETLLAEADGLISDRIDRRTGDQRIAVAATAVAALLLGGLVAMIWLVALRAGHGRGQHRVGQDDSDRPEPPAGPDQPLRAPDPPHSAPLTRPEPAGAR